MDIHIGLSEDQRADIAQGLIILLANFYPIGINDTAQSQHRAILTVQRKLPVLYEKQLLLITNAAGKAVTFFIDCGLYNRFPVNNGKR